MILNIATRINYNMVWLWGSHGNTRDVADVVFDMAQITIYLYKSCHIYIHIVVINMFVNFYIYNQYI